MDVENLIIELGYLNFSLGDVESKALRTRVDNLIDFFVSNLTTKKLLDVELVKLKPPWINHHIGEDRIAKAMMEHFNNLQQWVGSRGC